MSEETTTQEAPVAPKKKRGPGMSKITVTNPKNELTREELRDAFSQYEEVQAKIRKHTEEIAKLKHDSSEIVRIIVEDQGPKKFTVGGRLYKPGKHGESYFFIAPDLEALDLDS